jgi:UDP-glucuronate 4-epimerase
MPTTRPGETIVLTGVAGFIGSHVAEALVARGARVVGVDNLDPFYDPDIKRRTLAEIEAAADAAPGAFEFHRLDIRDRDRIAELFNRVTPDGVIHLAAKAGVRPSIERPTEYADVNVVGTAVILDASRDCGSVERVVCASSSSVYGDCNDVPFTETADVDQPISPYAATKRACELVARTHHHLYGMPTAMLRFFTVFGPRQRPDLAIAKFIRLLDAGETIPMFGDGSTSRDYTFIDDIVAGVIAAYDRIAAHGCRIWNLGNSSPVTLRDMIDTIARVIGVQPRIDQLPIQPGDVTRTFADIARANAELGYQPKTPFPLGVERQAAWFRSAREAV